MEQSTAAPGQASPWPSLRIKTEPAATTPGPGVDRPTFTLDELLTVFDAKLFCSSPSAAAAAVRRATTPGAGFVSPGSAGPTTGGAFAAMQHHSHGGMPSASTPEPPGPGGVRPFSPFSWVPDAAPLQSLGSFDAAARALSPDLRCGSPAPWGSLTPRGAADGWDGGSECGGRSGASSPDLCTRGGWCGPQGGSGSGASRLGGAYGGGAASDGRRPLAGISESGALLSPTVAALRPSGLSISSSCDGGSGSLSSSGGGGAVAHAAAAAAAQANGDDSDALCVVEVAMAAAVEATTRPPRGGRGGKHRQKAKLNQSLQQLAGHPDAEAAQAYVEAALAAYRGHGDAAALELLTRHLAYLIGGVVRFRLQGLIPWAKLPVPDPQDLADKSRTPTYKAWLVRLGVVPPEVFAESSSGGEQAGNSGGGGGGGGGGVADGGSAISAAEPVVA